ncbi:hypothetical protein Tco_0180023, partial [Tanacetum coccineum]
MLEANAELKESVLVERILLVEELCKTDVEFGKQRENSLQRKRARSLEQSDCTITRDGSYRANIGLSMKKHDMNEPEDNLEERYFVNTFKNMYEDPLMYRFNLSCAQRKYPLSAEVCKAMLDKKLQGGKPDEDCYKLLKMMEKQAVEFHRGRSLLLLVIVNTASLHFLLLEFIICIELHGGEMITSQLQGKLWLYDEDAIKSRFGSNDESKKMQKYILKQQFEGFSVSNSEGLHKGYDGFQSLLSQLEIHGAGVDSLSFDDLYNNLRVFESDVKGSTGSSSSAQNVAFVSFKRTGSTNDVSTAYGVSTSSGYNSQRENSSSYT